MTKTARTAALVQRCRTDAQMVKEIREMTSRSTGLNASSAEERVIENLAELCDILFGDR